MSTLRIALGLFFCLVVAGILFLKAATSILFSSDVSLKPFSCREGFEANPPDVKLWAQDGECIINYLGPTEEQAFEGKHSLKLDVTLKSGSYHYWGVSVLAPCAGKLSLSGRLMVARGTTASVGFGANYLFPPTRHSGCWAAETYRGPTNEWKLVQSDLVRAGKDGADTVIPRYAATAQPENVLPMMDRYAIFIDGHENDRAILYLDDVRIEGEVPSEADLQLEMKARWAGAQARLLELINGWRTEFAETESHLADLGQIPAALRPSLNQVNTGLVEAKKLVSSIEKQGYASITEKGTIDSAVLAARGIPEALHAVVEGMKSSQSYLISTPKPVINDRIPPAALPIQGPSIKQLSTSGCRGEHLVLSTEIYALKPLRGLQVEATAFKSSASTIPSSEVDIRVVKWWYQAGRSGGEAGHKVYIPELLLKDDRLVRVDTATQENFLRNTTADGTETYLLCSGVSSDNLQGVRPIDALDLQPVDVESQSTKEFWITIHIPEYATPGKYHGYLRFFDNSTSSRIPLTITVYPFELAPSPLKYSIYYRGQLSKDGKATIGSERKSEEQYRAEMVDMKAHGVLYPTNYASMDDPELLLKMLKIRQDVGLPTDTLFNLGMGTGSTSDAAGLSELNKGIMRWLDFCKLLGYREIYFYGADEAFGERLTAQRNAWQAVQAAGGKTFVACGKQAFDAMKGLLNCAVIGGRPDPTEAAKWHSVGSLAFCYAYPQVGIEEPETYRRNFGLTLRKAGYDGAMDYAYQHAFGHIWNDFDDKRTRDFAFAYPTVNGVVDTIEWEGFREGVTDVRYAATLDRVIKNAPANRSSIAKEARAWLDAIDPSTADLYAIRAAMVDWILRLTN